MRWIIALLLFFWASIAFAADTTVASGNNNPDQADALAGPYYIDENTALMIHWDTGDDLNFSTTSNGGTSWSTTEVEAGQNVQLACYAKWETPGFDTTTDDQVGCVWHDAAGSDAVKFVEFDVSAGTAGTVDTVTSSVTLTGAATNNRTAITFTESGNWVVVGNDGGSTNYAYDSSDGTTWNSHTAAMDAANASDHILLFPANGTGDTDDAALLYWDKSANEISVKMFDESANTWTETSVSTSMTDSSNYKNIDGAVRHSDGYIIVAAHSNDDSTGDDLKAWTIDADSISSPTVTGLTNVFTNNNENGQVAVAIDQQTDDIYVATIEGDPTFWATARVEYWKSTNGGTSWTGPTTYGESNDDHRLVHGPRSITSTGGIIQWSFFDDDDKDYYVNLTNDVVISAASGGGSRNRIFLLE